MLLETILAFIGISAASITDIKSREVPDWLNYALISAGLGIAAITSIVNKDLTIVSSLIGLGVGFSIGALMYYTGQWGGGDSKLLTAIGAIFGISLTFNITNLLNDTFVSIWFNTLLAGVIYAMLWSVVLAIIKFSEFSKEFPKQYDKTKLYRYLAYLTSILLILLAYFAQINSFRMLFASLSIVIFCTYFLLVFTKTVEKCGMYKFVKPSALTEGDWIAKDVVVDGKRITGPKDLGVRKEQIEILKKLYKQNKVKLIQIKEGIPFVPSFWFGFVMTLFYGNVVVKFLL